MNVGHFEQISDCWSLEGQPATTIAPQRRAPGYSRQMLPRPE